jgi:hypothetical protein
VDVAASNSDDAGFRPGGAAISGSMREPGSVRYRRSNEDLQDFPTKGGGLAIVELCTNRPGLATGDFNEDVQDGAVRVKCGIFLNG